MMKAILTPEELAKAIDHATLAANASAEDIRGAAAIARRFPLAAIFVNPCYVPMLKEHLSGTQTKVGAAIGFPLGATTPAVKAFEADEAIKRGAQEVDMVLNVGVLRSGNLRYVFEEVRTVVQQVRETELEVGRGPVIVKVIIETCYLTDEEKTAAAQIVEKAGADFVKTSTGLGTGGATVEDVGILRDSVGSGVSVKASGGIRTYQEAIRMLDAGATRIGTSNSVAILEEYTRVQAEAEAEAAGEHAAN